jgi:HSP20 family protein
MKEEANMTTAIAPKKDAQAEAPATKLARGLWPDFGLPSLNRLRHEFDDLWEKFYKEVPALWNAERTDLRWSFDVADQPESYVITAEAPGFEASDFNVELRGDRLVLQAKKSKEEKSKEKESFTSTEFYRSIAIPEFVATGKIEAAYDKGVLTVTLPKTPEGKGRKIPVKG